MNKLRRLSSETPHSFSRHPPWTPCSIHQPTAWRKLDILCPGQPQHIHQGRIPKWSHCAQAVRGVSVRHWNRDQTLPYSSQGTCIAENLWRKGPRAHYESQIYHMQHNERWACTAWACLSSWHFQGIASVAQTFFIANSITDVITMMVVVIVILRNSQSLIDGMLGPGITCWTCAFPCPDSPLPPSLPHLRVSLTLSPYVALWASVTRCVYMR